MPKEEDISDNIQSGMKYTLEPLWYKAIDRAVNIEDYLHLTGYKYDTKEVNKMDKQVGELQNTLVIMDKEKSLKKWKKLKQTWEEMKKAK